MCGLFGYAGERADPRFLASLAALARGRGPDAWGIWSDTDGLRRGAREIRPYQVARSSRGARVVIGHCRLSTMLGTYGARHAQPIVASDVVLAHNGNVWNYPDLRARLDLETGCDSEALAASVRCSGGLLEGYREAKQGVDLGDHYAVVLARGSEVLLDARRQSLYTLEDSSGLYWCSVSPGEGWRQVNTETLTQWRY